MNTLDALKIAREAMKERRAYCEPWEYKYGHEWDNEDGYIQDAIDKLSALEAEKPAEDAHDSVAAIVSYVDENIRLLTRDRASELYELIESQIQSFAHSYHLAECAKCKALPEDDVLERKA